MRALPLVLLLAACTGGTPALAPRAGVSFVGDAQGLAVPAAGKRVDFGRSPKGVIPLMERELGRGQALGLAGCPAGVIRQTDWGGLVLTFTDERFVGWRSGAGQAGQVCAVTS